MATTRVTIPLNAFQILMKQLATTLTGTYRLRGPVRQYRTR